MEENKFSTKQIANWRRIRVNIESDLNSLKKIQDKINTTEDECVTLRAQLAQLEEKAKMKDQLIAETKEYNEKFEKELVKYPANLDQEAAVVFFKGVEEAHDGRCVYPLAIDARSADKSIVSAEN